MELDKLQFLFSYAVASSLLLTSHELFSNMFFFAAMFREIWNVFNTFLNPNDAQLSIRRFSALFFLHAAPKMNKCIE